MKEVSVITEQMVTTKELADILGVDVDTINNTVNKLNFSDVHRKSTKGRPTKAFTEKQATLIKQEIQKHHNLATRQIDSVTTEEEENLLIKNAWLIIERRAEEFRRRAEIAENTLNRIADGKGCFTINQTAKALKLDYGNRKLFEKLRNEGILNQDNTPKQEQVNMGNFKVVVKFVNEAIGNKPVTLTTSKGLVYLAKRFKWEIDETVKADYQ